MNPNPQQQTVINHKDGPCLVAAVPGSGKTACLTARVGRLLELGVSPRQILAITFTNKAATEMKERIAKRVGEDSAKRMVVCTFHSLCARILRRHPREAGLGGNFTIFDADDQKRLLEGAFCKVLNLEKKSEIKRSDYNAVSGYLERTRNACLPDGSRKLLRHSYQYAIVDEYYKQLDQSNAVDFTGLLSLTLRLFESHPDILELYQDRFRYISVDEVQDTNVCQYRIVKLLASKYRNILMVGDINQSIYGFRSANPRNILTFEQDFGADVKKLETNYRSSPEILESAQQLIEHNKFRKETRLRTDNPGGPNPSIIFAETDEGMAFKIASYVDRYLRKGVKPQEVAILYRIKSATRVLELALRDFRIKYKIIGGRSFYERKEVKGCLAILRLMVNSNDRMAFENCVEHCCRGVGVKTLHKIAEKSALDRSSILDAARGFSSGRSKQAAVLAHFLDTLAASKRVPAHEGLEMVARETAFWDKMASDKNVEADRCGNILEMCRDVQQYMGTENNRTLERYLQDISLITSSDESGEEKKINLMTLHASKGLEFDLVVISHLNDGILPHENSLDIEDDDEREQEIEEERRLLYVGITRARRWLRMAYCAKRFKKEMDPSRFLRQTGADYLS